MSQALAGETPAKLGVALSGGGDSTALAVMMAEYAHIPVEAVTVNHGLRPEAAEEAAKAAELCASLGMRHETVNWSGWSGAGNLQDAARQARVALISDWAARRGIGIVALGHTQDDQAETFLMRLARGSGVDGLAAMAQRRTQNGIIWIRPLLGYQRQELREFLRARGLDWSDDPSNEDERFDRIKARKVLKNLEELGVSTDTLAGTATRMHSVRAVLEADTQAAAKTLSRATQAGDVEIDTAGFHDLPLELRQRLLAHALKWVSSSPYRPRLKALERLMASISDGRRDVLAGCIVTPLKAGRIRIGREPATVAGLTAKVSEIWDNRWAVEPARPRDDVEIRTLGEAGLALCPDWRETGVSRESLIATPSVWEKGVLIAAPLAGWPQGWSCRLKKGTNHYITSVLSH